MSQIRPLHVIVGSIVVGTIGFFILQYFKPALIFNRPKPLSVVVPTPAPPVVESLPQIAPPPELPAEVAVEKPQPEPTPLPLPMKWKGTTTTITDPNKLREIMKKWPTNNSNLEKLAKAEKAFTKHMIEAMKSEDQARLALNDLKDCVSNANKLPDVELSETIPKETRDALRNSGPQAQASCIAYGEKIAERFPHLYDEVKIGMKEQASPEALTLLRKMKSTHLRFPYGHPQ